MIVYLIHGFNVHDNGRGTTDSLKAPLERQGFEVVDLDYGWSGRVKIRLCNAPLAHFLAKLARPGSVAIGHSNGAAIAYQAARYGAPFSRLILINPALDCRIPFPWVSEARRGPFSVTPLKAVDVFFAPDDLAVWLAQWIPWSLWGAMGRYGYQGEDDRVRNHNLHQLLPETQETAPRVGHSGAFKIQRLRARLLGKIGEVLHRDHRSRVNGEIPRRQVIVSHPGRFA